MARKPLTSEQAAAARAITLAHAEESQVEREARIEFEALLAKRIEQARNRTNAAVFRARHTHGLSIAVITDTGFQNTNRKNVYDRLDEYAKAHPDFVPSTGLDASPVLKVAGLTVRNNDDHTVTVLLDHFDHVDLGNDFTGSILYSFDGDEISHDPELNHKFDENPLLGVIVWSLPEVQAGVE